MELKLKLIPRNKKGNKIYIKPENKGKFTEYCGGKVTLECIQKGKRSNNATIRKRATFAANARKWKHYEGGKINRFDEGGAIYASEEDLTKEQKLNFAKNVYTEDSDESFYDFILKYGFSPDELDFILKNGFSQDDVDFIYRQAKYRVDKGDSYYCDVPPNSLIVTGYSPLKLYTHYPLSDNYMIGHSALRSYDNRKSINTTMNTPGYNLVTNNCSDDTGKCLEQVFGKSMDVIGFTTPGDVKDFALENGGYEKNGVVYIPMNEERLHRFNRYAWDYNKRRGFKNMDVKDYPGVVIPEIKIDTSTPNNKPIVEPQSSTYVAPTIKYKTLK